MSWLCPPSPLVTGLLSKRARGWSGPAPMYYASAIQTKLQCVGAGWGEGSAPHRVLFTRHWMPRGWDGGGCRAQELGFAGGL